MGDSLICGIESVSVCGMYWDVERCDGPLRRAELVKNRLMGMGWERWRQELHTRDEVGRSDAILICADDIKRTILIS